VVYADSTAGKIFYQVEGSKLTFYTGCYAIDAGHREVYERISGSGGSDCHSPATLEMIESNERKISLYYKLAITREDLKSCFFDYFATS